MKYDVIIIGFGKAGKTLAYDLGQAGKRVLLVEKSDKMFGGTCINEGCIPSKFLIEEASKEHTDNNSHFEKVMEEKAQLVEALRNKNFEKLDKHDLVDVLVGEASFIDEKEIEVKTNEKTLRFSADKFVINTGSESVIPNIYGVDSPLVYTSREMLSLKKLPKELVVIGGGYIGLEFASMYRSFGSEVTVLIKDKEFLPKEDKDISLEIKNVLESKGIKFIFEANTSKISTKGDLATLYINTSEGEIKITANAILLATGRKPNTLRLNLDKAKVETNSRGGIVVDKYNLTTNKKIYAAGDVIGEAQFTYISLDDYRIIKSHMLGDKSYDREKRKVLSYSVFITPAFSRVGLTEAEALAKGYEIKVAKMASAMIPKAKVLKNSNGLLKVIVDSKTNLILGAHLFCLESYEIINLVKLAIDNNLPYTVLKDMVYTHPTMSESLNDLLTQIK